jgi:polyferredoxin
LAVHQPDRFHWIFFFLIPEFLFEWAIKYQWVGDRLAYDPAFAGQAWRSYGIIYAWPLFFYTFFYDPHKIWLIWGVLLSFVIISIFVLFHGKRYCSWICGGGLEETFGDRWRHLAPKGRTRIRWEWMNLAVLIFASVVTVAMLLRDSLRVLSHPATGGLDAYHLIADIWLVGILPVTLYPFFGGKVWCRYWCPLTKLMHLFSEAHTKLGVSRFRIVANDKCIACTECTRNCQVGIDVMGYALKQQPLDNGTLAARAREPASMCAGHQSFPPTLLLETELVKERGIVGSSSMAFRKAWIERQESPRLGWAFPRRISFDGQQLSDATRYSNQVGENRGYDAQNRQQFFRT